MPGNGGAGSVGFRPAALAAKELKIFFTDMQMLFFSLALPLLLLALMVASFGGQEQFRATAYVVNLDRGQLGAEVIAHLKSVPGLRVQLLDEATASSRLDRSQILSAIVIPSGFSEDVALGRTPELIVRRRGTGGDEGQIVASYAMGIGREVVAEQLAASEVARALATMGSPVDRDTVSARVASLMAQSRTNPPVVVEEKAVGARVDPVGVYLPGLVTMFTLFALTLSSVAIVEERKKGTLERLMTTRLTRGEMLAGMWLGSLGRGLFQVLFLFVVAGLVFRLFTPASFARTLVFAFVAVLSASGMGLAIAAIARTADQANWIAVFFTMVMTILGGSFFDMSGAQGGLAALTRLTYNFWANDGLRRLIVRGELLSSPAIIRDFFALAVFGAIGWLVALVFFRTRGDAR